MSRPKIEEQHLQCILLFLFDKGLTPKEATESIFETYGHILNIRKCRRWFKRFKGGDRKFKNKRKRGRPPTFDVDVLNSLIELDPRKTMKELSEDIGCSQSLIKYHLIKLGKEWRRGVRVPYDLSESASDRHVCSSLPNRLNMSQKIQPCSVSLEPLVDKMDNTKKKSGKTSEHSTPVPQDATENIDKMVEVDGESSQAKTAVNGKSKKDKTNKTKDKSVTNGVSDVALNSNGTSNGNGSPLTVDDSHPEVIEEEALVPNSDQDNDELFPELIYDETSDECNFDSSSPDFSPVGRSVTRRSQAKIVPTPETPQLISKADTGTEVSSSPAESLERPSSQDTQLSDQIIPMKEKVSLLKEVFSQTLNKPGSEVASGCIVKDADSAQDIGLPSTNESSLSRGESNGSKLRVKDSPYRRSARISDQYSTMANYSGNNSTQDTEVVGDITSSSRDHSPILDTSEDGSIDSCKEAFQEETVPLNYTEHLRSMKGRRSYKPLREISLRNLTAQRQKISRDHMSSTVSSANATVGSEINVNALLSESPMRWIHENQSLSRKRRSSRSDSPAAKSPALVLDGSENDLERPSKRQRLFGIITTPFKSIKNKISSSTPIVDKHAQAQVIVQNDSILSPSQIIVEGEGKPNDEQMPMVSDIVPGKEEHKWCSIM